MTAPEFYLQLDEMLELPAATITGTERLSDLGKWDSLEQFLFR